MTNVSSVAVNLGLFRAGVTGLEFEISVLGHRKAQVDVDI